MTTQSVKGLLKGLRYISQIFDEKEEANIEIGFPTDVKHVAHIGSDGPSNAQPTWMNEFSDTSKQQPPQSTQAPEAATQENGQQNIDQMTLDSPTRRRKSNKKQSRRQSSSDGGLILESASRELIANPTTTTTTTTSKPRRHKTSSSSGETPASESTTTTTTRNAKAPTHRKKTGSDKVPKPKTRGSRSSGQGSSDVTNEMSLELVAEEGDDDIDENGVVRGNKRAL